MNIIVKRDCIDLNCIIEITHLITCYKVIFHISYNFPCRLYLLLCIFNGNNIKIIIITCMTYFLGTTYLSSHIL